MTYAKIYNWLMYEKEKGTVALVLKSVLSKVRRDAWRKGSECICQGICSVGLIEAAMQTQKDVVVFCKNGRSRSPSVIAAFILLFGECLWTTSKLGLQRLTLSNAQRQLESLQASRTLIDLMQY
jgi:hypothetical protein